jgi:hypothetical protein
MAAGGGGPPNGGTPTPRTRTEGGPKKVEGQVVDNISHYLD